MLVAHCGVAAAGVKVLKAQGLCTPSLNDGLLPSILILAYVFFHARREPKLLDTWGLTTPISKAALAFATAMLAFAIGSLLLMAKLLAAPVEYRAEFVSDMVNYIVGAFPQQFIACSLGFVWLAERPVFRGPWRLPIFVGLVFALAHFWTPARIPGTIIPVQMLITLPMGVAATYYFLRFRTIMPLVIMHAILWVLYFNWIERHI